VLPDGSGAGTRYQLLLSSAPAPRHRSAAAATSTIVFSAGSTGRPKPVLRTFGTDLWDGLQKALLYRLAFDEVWLYITPKNLTALIGPTRPLLVTGSTYAVIDAFSPEAVCAAVERERVTQLTLLAGQWAELLDWPGVRGFDLSSLRQVAAAASPVPSSIRARMAAVLGPKPSLQVYGLSEGGMVSAAQDSDPQVGGCVGRPLPMVDVRVVDGDSDVPRGEIGEVVVRGPSASPGYYNRPEAQAATFVNGWVRTGDFGRMDDSGYLYLVGRASESFMVGRSRIFPAVAQDRIASLPGVRDSGVVRDPRPEVPGVVAFVVLAARSAAPAELDQRIVDAVGSADVTSAWAVVVEALPRTSAGKLDVASLRQMAADLVRTD
jgi:acyl-CoA synthetase (AMP-forming)/AMP-acid ligase II